MPKIANESYFFGNYTFIRYRLESADTFYCLYLLFILKKYIIPLSAQVHGDF